MDCSLPPMRRSAASMRCSGSPSVREDGMALSFEQSLVRLWFELRAVDDVIGLGFGPKIVDGKLVSPRQLVIYKAGKDSVVPEISDVEVRLPRLTNRHVTVKERQHQCLTDYQWLFWNKIDKLNKSQRKQVRRDTPRSRAKHKRKGSGAVA